MPIWNPWHGCHKISEGCRNCYVYRRDESIGKDAGIVMKTGDFNLPMKKTRQGEYKLQPTGTVFTCMTSDFFLEDADEWRDECWRMMKARPDLDFAIITKRIHRFTECMPDDWGENGYPNVTVFCTVENQQMADYRLPIYLSLPLKNRHICHEPMLGPVNIEPYLATGKISYVLCGGESGSNARPCNFDWVLDTRRQCIRYHVPFHFKQTGAVFIKDGKTYHIERRYQMAQAEKANIDTDGF